MYRIYINVCNDNSQYLLEIYDSIHYPLTMIHLNSNIKYYIIISFGFLLLTLSCKKKMETLIDIDKTYAWCIVPYDDLQRSPEERLGMLKRLGFKKYAYDWREKHLPSMAKELILAKKNNIEVISIWMWIDGNWDSIDGLNRSNNTVFSILEKVNYNGQIWVSFNPNFFENLSNSEAIKKGAAMIAFLSKKANSIGCKVALYNHGGWFGEPQNQIEIIKSLPDEDLGIIYNFHHGHNHIDNFNALVSLMMPYLWSVSINGMSKEGPRILTVGKGEHEKDMINLLLEKGYNGDFGIIAHDDNSDAEIILKANLEGLKN